MRDILGTVGSLLLSLVALIAVGALIYEGYGWYKTGQASQDTSKLVTNIQAAYSNQPTFSSLTNTAANANGWTPKDWDATGGSIQDQWGGAVTVNVDGSDSSEFDVTLTKVSSSGCQKLAAGMTNAVSESINGSAVSLPIDAATIGTDCSSSSNTLLFVMGH